MVRWHLLEISYKEIPILADKVLKSTYTIQMNYMCLGTHPKFLFLSKKNRTVVSWKYEVGAMGKASLSFKGKKK